MYSTNYPLHQAVLRGDVRALSELLRRGKDVNSMNNQFTTLLGLAAYTGSLPIIKIPLPRELPQRKRTSMAKPR